MNEVRPTNLMDWISFGLGRLSMFLIAGIVCIMIFEVFMRYVLESATLWVNGTSFWMCAFVFLFAGLYAMQQRSHIRIFVVYDLLPRNVQRGLDVMSTLLIIGFTFAMIWGGFNEAYAKAMRWERFGETWRFAGVPYDPPIPATLKPTILVVLILISLQSLVNLIKDWNKEKELHLPSVDD